MVELRLRRIGASFACCLILPGQAAMPLVAMLQISPTLAIPLNEVELSPIRAQGTGGQNVNKVESAIHLRFDIQASSLPTLFKERLLRLQDQRISKEGVIVLRAQEHRTQEANRNAALERLVELIRSVLHSPKRRVASTPSRAAKRRRLDSKSRRASVKAGRRSQGE